MTKIRDTILLSENVIHKIHIFGGTIMQFTILKEEKQAVMFVEKQAFSGVRKVAQKVCGDLELVTGKSYMLQEAAGCLAAESSVVFAGTLGTSPLLDRLEAEGILSSSKIRDKWECYQFQIISVTDSMRVRISELAQVKELLVIAGSDKRGTIYGLFHLSELLGVSPWVYWADVMPKKQDSIVFTEEVNHVSKEPSVKYRGFFINDEWPSFGTWTMKHFGGFTAEMYDHVFELLLRLKGNYLWPAMWTSSFSLDGPGLRNAELADEYGIVMSNSHHEPCLRHSEEWDLVRGDDSKYGNAWNFDQNREGLIEYWRDALKRNGGFENIITIGMRGERDSKILGHDVGLADNINYLKEVIETQNQLIRETVNPDLDQVPRMLALYKEVEAYYYGDETAEGLADWEELDGVTLMLCEDNFGNMRTLPAPEKKNRKGGWGMYYHFDYHGDPVSYEWVNSTHLKKVWEQMGMAYEMGIRDIWIVNVGDLKPQELPLSFFLDLAYDFDTWGRNGASQTDRYTRAWVNAQFGADFSEEERNDIYRVIEGYTKQNSIRKPEALYPDTYHPVHYLESERTLEMAEQLEAITEALHKKALTLLDGGPARYASFYELVYFPVMASMNLLKMQLYAGKNELYAKQGRVSANLYAEKITACIERDRELQATYHSVADGKWDGIMSSEHVGFVNWNDEECCYPSRITMEPANKPRMIVALADETVWSAGGDWTRKKLVSDHFMSPYVNEMAIDIANGGRTSFAWQAECDAEWLKLSEMVGEVVDTTRIVVTLDRGALRRACAAAEIVSDGTMTAHIKISAVRTWVEIEVNAADIAEEHLEAAYVSCRGVAVEASNYSEKIDGTKGVYVSVPCLGKYATAEKLYPVTETCCPGVDAPSLAYDFYLPEDGDYQITFLSTPSNPVSAANLLRFGIQWGEEAVELVDAVSRSYQGGERSCRQWAQGVLDQIHEVTVEKSGKKGKNRLVVYACDAAYVLERILVIPKDAEWKKSYLGIPSVQ